MDKIIEKGTMVQVWIVVYNPYGEHQFSYEYQLEEDTCSKKIWAEAASRASWEANGEMSDDFSFDVEFKQLAS